MKVFVYIDGKTLGSYTLDQLRNHVQAGKFKDSNFACYDGKNWVKIKDVLALKAETNESSPNVKTDQTKTLKKFKENPKMKGKFRFKKPLSQRIFLGGYLLTMFISIPAITTSVMFERESSNPLAAIAWMASIAFTIKILRYHITCNCLSLFFKKHYFPPSKKSFMVAFIKPSWIHIILLGFPLALALLSSGGSPNLAGVGLVGSCVVPIAYLFALDIPFRIKANAKSFMCT